MFQYCIYIIISISVLSSCSESVKTPFTIDNMNEGISETKQNSIGLKEESLTPFDYIKWVRNPENNLIRLKKIEEYEYELLHKPLPYLISLDQKKEIISKNDYTILEKQ